MHVDDSTFFPSVRPQNKALSVKNNYSLEHRVKQGRYYNIHKVCLWNSFKHLKNKSL